MKCILFIALLLPSFLWAQENNKKKNSIQIIKGIGIGHQILENSPWISSETCMDWTESSKAGLNYRFGIDYQRQIIGGLSVKIGGRFSMWSLNDVTTVTNCYICCTGGCGFGLEEEKLRQYYVEMPLALQYKFGKKKLQFYVEIGVNPMLDITNNDYSTDNDDSRNKDPFYVALQVGTGLSYQLSNNCSLFGQVSSRVQTKKLEVLNSNYGYWNTSYGHLYEIGLELGVGFSF
jgi:hypothetical protein